ncbi:MAG: DNA polymerase IV, partial [Candidatus Omnitrophica bacterium]|nr:DNA polymerase IV [Candidatus Omnitrophota bacterium]
MILHIDMDAFFASIEQAINPRLKGKPLIVGSRPSRMRTVVCAASYEAKTLGIDSGTSSAEAFKICPNLEFVAADQAKYIWTSEQIFGLLQAYGYQLNYASIDEFQMDIGETNGLEIAQKIRSQIYANFNITASVGIAKNWLLSKLASKLNKPNGIAIITEENITQVLGKTPAKKLCGVGEKTSELLLNLGIKTCLDLYQKSARFLEKFLGQNGVNLYLDLHSNEAFDIKNKEEKPKSIGHSYTLPRAAKTPGFIQGWIRLLCEMVAERLRQKQLVSQTVHLWLNGPEIGNFAAQKTFEQATNDGYEVYQRCLKIMAKTGLKTPRIRALGVTCGNLSKTSYPPLFIEQKR